MSLTTCLKKAGAYLPAEDKAAILARSKELRGQGKSSKEAAEQAVSERIAMVRGLLGSGADAAIDTHKDPGEPAEPATPAVVKDALQTAARNDGRPIKDVKAEALRLIDEAMAKAPSSEEIDAQIGVNPPKTIQGKKVMTGVRRFTDDRTVMVEARETRDGKWSVTDESYDGSGTGRKRRTELGELQGTPAVAREQLMSLLRRLRADGTLAEPDMVTINVPGDGEFKVVNTKERLAEFRRKVENSPGFKAQRPGPIESPRVNGYGSKQSPGAPFGVEGGSGSKADAFANMVDDGDMQAAIEYAEAVGIDPEKAKLPDTLRQRLDKWQRDRKYAAPEPAETPAPAAEAVPAKPDRAAQREALEQIAERLGVKVFKSGSGWHASGDMVSIPDDDVDTQSAIHPNHVFAHELGHVVMTKRGFTFQGFPKAEVVKRIANYDDLIAASKEFRPGVHQHENDRFRRHAMKPNEVLADGIAAVLLGDKPISLIEPLMQATGMTRRDLGLADEAPAASPTPAEDKAASDDDMRGYAYALVKNGRVLTSGSLPKPEFMPASESTTLTHFKKMADDSGADLYVGGYANDSKWEPQEGLIFGMTWDELLAKQQRGGAQQRIPEGKMPKDAVLAYSPAATEPKAPQQEAQKQGETAPMPPVASIPRDVAQRAHEGTSFTPERRAEQEQESFMSALRDAWGRAARVAGTDEKAVERITEVFNDVADGYRTRYLATLGARSRVMSSMIAGPARFPVERNRKRMETERRRAEEAQQYLDRGIKRLMRAARGPIDNSPESELERVRLNLSQREEQQEMMKAANVALRKGDDEALQDLGFTDEQIADLKKPDFAGRNGFPDYKLTNNSAEIRRLRERLQSAEQRMQDAASGPAEREVAGVRVVEDATADRIRLYFDGKPDLDVRVALKANGFRWSPKEGAWQRQLTGNARAAADAVLKKMAPDTGSTEQLSAADADADAVTAAWKSLAKNDDLFSLPRSQAKGMEAIFAEVAPKHTIEPGSNLPSDVEKAWYAYAPGVQPALERRAYVIQYKDGRVEVNLSKLNQGEAGSAIYAAVGNYAHNNGLEFAGDRLGISKIGMTRRLENMISLALKFGTTDFMTPHPTMLKAMGIDWKAGDSDHNLQQMLMASYNNAIKIAPELKNVGLAADSRGLASLSTGVELTAAESQGLVLRVRAAGLPVGDRTLRRFALTASVLGAKDQGAREGLLGRIGAWSRGDVEFPQGLRRVAYSVADGAGVGSGGPSEPASDRHQQLAAEYQQRLQGRFPGAVFDAVGQGDGGRDGAAGTGPAGDGVPGSRSRERAAVATVAKRLFGHEVVFVRFPAGVKPLFNGAMSTAMPGVVFINADAQKPMMAVLGHELVHQMASGQKALYQILARRLNTVLKNEQQYIDLLDLKYTPEQRKELRYGEELHADVVGDFFTDPQFWQDMSKDQPGLFRKVAQAIIRFLDNAIQKITEIRPFGTEQYITDLNAARAAVVDAMRQFSGAQVGAMTSQSDGINLSPSERDQTKSPEFRRWFGDSKVVDEQGKPLVVYHGTLEDFAQFDPEATEDGAFHFGTIKAAEDAIFDNPGYEEDVDEDGNAAPAVPPLVMPVYLSIQNPMRSQDQDGDWSKAIAKAKRLGHDGIVYRNAHEDKGSVSWIAFRPEQIKSAIGNRGTFDPASSDINLSIADEAPRNIRGFNQQSIRDRLADTFGSAGAKVSWIDKTLATQYAKAQKYPEFRKVFNHVQSYLEDTSTLANEAADQAKDILPKLETWRDLKHNGLSDADAQAIAAPIFEGTLTEKRVFDDAELRDTYGLDEKQIGLYRQFLASVNTSLDQAVAADVLRLLGDVPVNFRAMVMNNREGMRAGIDRYLGEQIRTAEATNAIDNRNRLIALREDIREKYLRIDKLKDEGYAPLMRFGKYLVNVTDQATGESLFFGLYETKAEANRMARELGEDPQFEGLPIEQGVLSQEQYKLFSAVPVESLEMFADAIGADQSPVFQEYLRLAKNNRSALKRLIHRKGTAGFSQDVDRVLAAFVTSNSRLAAGSMNLPAAKDAIQQIRSGDVKDEAIALVDTVETPTDTAAPVRSLMFMNFIGGSIASAMVNLTQPVTMTLPYLSRWGGIMKAGGRLMAAGKLAASGKVSDPVLRAALQRAEDDGIVSPQEIHHLQAQAMATFGTNPYAKKLAFIWGAPFSLAEQFNRRVSFIAAFQTAREQGMADPFAFAENAVIETQGLYNRGNAPNLARTGLGAAALTFKQFSIHYLEWMGRMYRSGPEGKRAVLYALAILMLAAGTDGLPFAEDVDDLVDTITQALGLDMPFEDMRRSFIADTLGLGDEAADVMTRGFSAMGGMPLDVSLRLGMGNLLPATGILLRSNTDRSRDVLEVAGPAGSLAKQYMDAGQKVLRGDAEGALQSALPVALQNVWKAASVWSTGEYRDSMDRKVMEVDEVAGLMKFLGFQPAEIARESKKLGRIRRSEQLAKNVEGEIAAMWARGIADSEPDTVAKARQKLADWNENNPESQIRITTAQIVQRVKKMREDRSERFIRGVSPERRARVAEELQ